MKGISSLLSAVLVIGITIALGILVSGWIINLSAKSAGTIKNQTTSRLECQYGGLYLKAAVYECNNTCFTGIPYRLNLTLQNTGSIKLYATKSYTKLTNGQTYTLSAPLVEVNASSIITASFNSTSTSGCTTNNTLERVMVSSDNCPETAYDSIPYDLITFSNCSS